MRLRARTAEPSLEGQAPALTPSSHRGFSLVELLVAVTILALLATLLLLILDATTKLWRVNEQRVDSSREARAGLNLMARELRSLVVLDPAIADSLRINPASGGEFAAVDNNHGSLFFVSALPARAQEQGENKSDLCALGYFMAFTTDPGGGSSYKIYRYFRSSDDTFARIPGNALFADISTAQGDTRTEPLARNITGLTIRGYRRTGTNLEEVTPWPDNERPAMVEVEITAINAETAVKLPNQAAWDDSDNALIVRALQTFTLRVPIATHPEP